MGKKCLKACDCPSLVTFLLATATQLNIAGLEGAGPESESSMLIEYVTLNIFLAACSLIRLAHDQLGIMETCTALEKIYTPLPG